MVVSARSGFTLIEILSVILIVGILAAVLVFNLRDASEAANVAMTRSDLGKIEAAIDAYENQHGDYPPSSFASDQGVANDGNLNAGVEALVVSLWSHGYEAGGLLEPDGLLNTDGDAASGKLGDLGRELLEFVDRWQNPIAYVHRRDYESKGLVYGTIDPQTGEELVSSPTPFQNATTGRFYNASKYQLISAGEDGRFGTEDDITTFER
jgi:prepilin-type N-terminal cleavage/methylation domain-containing protein